MRNLKIFVTEFDTKIKKYYKQNTICLKMLSYNTYTYTNTLENISIAI